MSNLSILWFNIFGKIFWGTMSEVKLLPIKCKVNQYDYSYTEQRYS